MRSLRPLALAVLMVSVLFTGACDGEPATTAGFDETCRLPSPLPGAADEKVPARYVPPGAVVRQVQRLDGLVVYAFNVPLSVDEGVAFYKRSLRGPPYELISEDNEGFEAEIYWRDGDTGDFIAVQLREPGCSTATGVFVSVGQPQVPLTTPSPTMQPSSKTKPSPTRAP